VISHQIWFWAKPFQRQVPQPGVLGAPDPVLAPGPLPVPQLQVSELALLRIGGEAGEPVPVDVGEPQLRARVRALLADDDPHPRGPAIQVRQPGDVRDPGAVADLPVAVISRCPRLRGDLPDRPGDWLGDRHADGVAQPPGLGGQPGEELVRAAAGISADQHLAAQVPGQLRQREPGRLDMVSRGVRAGVAGPQHQGQRLPVAVCAVAGPGGHGVMAEGLTVD
jgi:hypothetical protein